MNDLKEATINMLSGMVINCMLTYFIFGVTPLFALGTSTIFFCVSWTRTYIIRRIFRYLEER